MTESTIAKVTPETEVTTTEATREPERYVTPLVDIYETKEGLHVLADLPGSGKELIDLNVDNNILTIKAGIAPREGAGPDYGEFALTNYFRQFTLGEKIDQEKITADYRNGVLALFLPIAAVAKPRHIEVKVA